MTISDCFNNSQARNDLLVFANSGREKATVQRGAGVACSLPAHCIAAEVDSSQVSEPPGTPPSQFNKGGSIYSPLIFGLDTLVMGFYVKSFILTEPEWLYLAEQKENAKASVFSLGGSLVEFQGKPFTLRPAGKAPYTYVLTSDDLTVKIALKPSHGRFPEVYIEFRSEFLWRGYIDAYRLVSGWVSTWAMVDREVVSRVDLTVDIQGTPVFTLENKVSRGRLGETIHVFSTGEEITGYRFGKSPLCLRIYNKTEEIKHSCKTWFYDLWLDNGLDINMPVWRVEFQLTRDCLNELKLDTFTQLHDSLGSIWKYLSCEWFTLREIVPDDTNKTRWPLLPFWQTVQKMSEHFGPVQSISRGKSQTRG